MVEGAVTSCTPSLALDSVPFGLAGNGCGAKYTSSPSRVVTYRSKETQERARGGRCQLTKSGVSTQNRVNECYKKGCQEKSSASTGGEVSVSRSSPLKFRFPG